MVLKFDENCRDSHGCEIIIEQCKSKYFNEYNDKTARIRTGIKINIEKSSCRDPGLFRTHAISPDLNQGPSDLQSDALPTELSRQLVLIMAEHITETFQPSVIWFGSFQLIFMIKYIEDIQTEVLSLSFERDEIYFENPRSLYISGCNRLG